MFTMSFRHVYRVCDKIFIRNLRGGRLGPNPGLDNRVAAFKKEGVKINADDVEEFIDNSESDFYTTSEAFEEHKKQSRTQNDKLRLKIVKEKYFKENMPNLLTWSEKEQIRHLCAEHPEEWTPERVAESFPVTPPIVQKLLKYPWKPSTEDRIARHDASAMRNWRDLKEGYLDIPKDLREHFLKFSDRTIPPLRNKPIKMDVTPESNIGEFQSIIDRCAAKEEPNNSKAHSTQDNEHNNTEHRKPDTKRVTLDELTAKIKRRLDAGNDVQVNDQIILKTVEETPVITTKDMSTEIELHEETQAVTEFKDEKEIKIQTYPDRIRIPKKSYKKGATYKVNDCYYDHDGRFMYRVLGMSN